jgi:hypothetical protein
VAVTVAVPVGILVGVLVAVAVRVAVGVLVEVRVDVGVAVFVPAGVLVAVAARVDVAVSVAVIEDEVKTTNCGGLLASRLEKLITLVLEVVRAKVTSPLLPTNGVTSTEMYPAPPNGPEEPTTGPVVGALL